MIQIRRSSERGHFDHGWLDTYHTFSFSGYRDPGHVRFRSLRVINEDRVAPGQGFGTHGHEDMEIITCVLEGELAHRDSLGTGSTIRPGELQRMTAGTGIEHSEFNPSATQPLHLYQIWLFPGRKGLTPSYDQKAFPEEGRRDRLRLVASPGGDDGSLSIGQDARLFLGTLGDGKAVSHGLAQGRAAWLQVLRGGIELDGSTMEAGDGAAIADESGLTIRARGSSEILLFDLS